MVLEIFPQVRSLIAKELVDTLGFTQAEAALKMGISQPAVSQYKKDMRATKISIIESYPAITKLIKDSAKDIAKSQNPENFEILCGICRQIRSAGVLREFYRRSTKLKDCDNC
ncbi:MAG: helix-turn-helix domain-containing protein [archaeon]